MIAPFDPAKPTSTASFLATYAATQPDAVAVIDTDRAWNYAEMHRDIGRFARALGEFSLSPGDIVAVEWTEIYPHWIILLAFETLGIITASYSKTDLPYSQELMDTVTLVLYAPKSPKPRARRLQAITPEWLENCFAMDPEDISAGLPPTLRPARAPYSRLRHHRKSQNDAGYSTCTRVPDTAAFMAYEHRAK